MTGPCRCATSPRWRITPPWTLGVPPSWRSAGRWPSSSASDCGQPATASASSSPTPWPRSQPRRRHRRGVGAGPSARSRLDEMRSGDLRRQATLARSLVAPSAEFLRWAHGDGPLPQLYGRRWRSLYERVRDARRDDPEPEFPLSTNGERADDGNGTGSVVRGRPTDRCRCWPVTPRRGRRSPSCHAASPEHSRRPPRRAGRRCGAGSGRPARPQPPTATAAAPTPRSGNGRAGDNGDDQGGGDDDGSGPPAGPTASEG